MLSLLEMFDYAFMQKAFIIGGLLGIIIPFVGVVSVLRRLSMTGDALSHSSLAGVAIGLVAGLNPVYISIIVCVLSAFAIEFFRRKMPQYSEMSVAIVMSLGVGIAGVMSGFVKSGSSFQSFLFGSILAVTDFEFWLVVGVSFAVILLSILLYKELMHVTFDENSAKLAGIPVNRVNFIFTILNALTVAAASRTVGTLVVSTMMVLPVAVAMQFSKSYKHTVILSCICGVAFIYGGLVSSYLWDFKPGGSIALIGVIALVISFIIKAGFKKKI